MRKLRAPFISGIVTVFLLTLFTVTSGGAPHGDEKLLRVTFLDVGQGDATFIESPSGTQVLIDGGKGSTVLAELGREMGFFDRTIDMVVVTHPDLDHIGGLIPVFERYDVETVLMTENLGDTPAFDALLTALEEEGTEIIYARRGQTLDIGSGPAGSTTIRVLFPDRDPTYLESNSSSIVAQLVYGENEFMLTGDSPKEIEEYLVLLGSTTLESDVLKVGHHGSRTSTGEMFVSAVDPAYAVVSSGKDNSYGHPHKEVTELLSAHGVVQKNTAGLGSISFVSNGEKLWLR